MASAAPNPDDAAAPGSAEEVAQRHFIVFFRDAAWQFTYRGSITGPFASREVAIAEAIREARESGIEDVEVIVQQSDMRQETVWRLGP